MSEFTVKIKVSDGTLADIFVTAMEGGVNYWAAIHLYRHHVDTNRAPDQVHALLYDAEDEGDRKILPVNFKTIRDGIALILKDELVCSEVFENVKTAVVEDDASAIDANDADCIVQAGLFGKLVYG